MFLQSIILDLLLKEDSTDPQQPNRQLQSILFGQNKTDEFSTSEINLMTGSDVAEAIPNIREVIDSENEGC